MRERPRERARLRGQADRKVIDMSKATALARGYWDWNGRAFQSVKANLGYWVASACVVIEVVLWVR